MRSLDLPGLGALALATLRRWGASAATPGSATGMMFAALLAGVMFATSAASVPAPRPIAPPQRVSGATVPAGAPALQGATALLADDGVTPVGAPPPPAIDTAFDYPVVFYWPATPQTVSDAVAIREGPAASARVLRSARPGERLRINGRVADLHAGPWFRVRLDDGRDGYFSARTVAVEAWRRQRAAEAKVAGDPALVDALGAPLPTPPDEGPDPDIAPPTF